MSEENPLEEEGARGCLGIMILVMVVLLVILVLVCVARIRPDIPVIEKFKSLFSGTVMLPGSCFENVRSGLLTYLLG